MELTRLRVEDLRLIERVELDLASGWNFFLGANGAGKTSVLEAAFLLSHGRSFRATARDALVRHGSLGYSVFGELRHADGQNERVGVARSGGRLEARLNGQGVPVADLLRHTAVLCFEPGSHELISGSSEERRRFLDWGVFHVEHEFLHCWRRYQRALKQRNALLRRVEADSDLDAWDREMVLAAVPLTTMRQRYVDALRPVVVELLFGLLGELGEARLYFQRGFDEDKTLAAVLGERRRRDIARGHTTAGPHRADWSLSFGNATKREHLSRGQEKLCAFACVMAQARVFAAGEGGWPILCLDDLASELDGEHQRKVFDLLLGTGAQILATGTDEPAAMAGFGAQTARFHVEQGRVTRLL
ncbi:MAG: DNA replication/repair protein RecF [Dokdonella sp.]